MIGNIHRLVNSVCDLTFSSDAPEFWHNHNLEMDSRYPIFFFKITKVTGFDEDSSHSTCHNAVVYKTDQRTSLFQVGGATIDPHL